MARFTMYKDSRGEWRWRFRANNGKIIADSAEGYKEKTDCRHGIDLVKQESPNAEVIEADNKPG